MAQPSKTQTRKRKALNLTTQSAAFFLPIILFASFINAGPSSCNPRPPSPPDFTISKNSAGVAADDDSIDGFASGTGFNIAFSSFATNLDPGTSVFQGPHVFVHNTVTRETTWVNPSTAFGGTTSGADSPVLSDDGRYIAFKQQWGSIHAVMFRDLEAPLADYQIITALPDPVSAPTMSSDGRYVGFATEFALLPEDTDTVSDVYLTDRSTGTLTYQSTQATGGAAALQPQLSGDGQVFAFEVVRGTGADGIVVTDVAGILFATFLAGDSPSISDDGNLVAFRRGIFAPNAIYTHELLVGPPEEVSLDTSGNPSTDDCDHPVLSGDGRYVAFSCVAPMTDHGAANQVYVRDLIEQTTKLASLSINGDPADSADSKPVSITTNGNAVIIESSAGNLGSAPGGYPQMFRVPISYWEESGGTGCSSNDATCDGVDDDCDGQTDEDYVSQATGCGVGACASTGATSCSNGQVVNSCVPGTPSAMDAMCDGVDEDCDGTVDEDATFEQTTCPLGGCLAVVTGPCGGPFDCVANGVCISETACADAADNDSDGLVDCWDSDCFASTDCANAAPVLSPVGAQTVTVGEILRFTLSATDSDGDPLSYDVSPLPLPANATLNGETGEFEYAPTLSQIASNAFEFLASDGRDTGVQTAVITVIAPQPGGPTAITGLLIDAMSAAANDDPLTPVVGATITDLANPDNSVVSDANGAFTLQGLAPGQVTIEFDGEMAAPPPVPETHYGAYRATVTVEAGTIRTLSQPVFLPHVDETAVVNIDPLSTEDAVLTNATLEVTVTIEPGTVVDADTGADYEGPITLSSVPPDFTPGALPDTLNPSTVITIQPMGLRFMVPAAVRFPNELGLAPGSIVDLWSLDHATGEFFSPGTGQVTPDGMWIDSVDGGGIQETSWHFFGPPPPEDEEDEEGDGTGDGGSSGGGDESGSDSDTEEEGGCSHEDCPIPQPNDPNDEDEDGPPDEDPCADLASSMPLAKGTVRVRVELPSYKVLSEPFAHKLVYHSLRAFPYYLLAVNSEIPQTNAVPSLISYSTAVGGSVQSQDKRYISTAGFLEIFDEPFRVVPGIDATEYPTAVFPIEVRVTSHYGEAEFGAIFNRILPVINDGDSPFGAGWGWSGLRRLANAGTLVPGLLMIDGNGGHRVFRLIDGVFVSPPGDASTLLANGDGTHTLQRTDGVETDFDVNGAQTRILFPNGNVWQYNYNPEGKLSSIVDPTGGATIVNYEGDFISEVIDPANRKTEFDHQNGDLIRVVFPDGSKREFGYDDRHLMTSETNARGFTKYRDFGFAGRLTGVTLEDTSERQVTVAATQGFIAPNSSLGLTKETPTPFVRPDRISTVEDAEGRTQTFEVGAFGKVTKFTDAADLVTTLERDDDGNLARIVRPSGQSYFMTYDAEKNLLSRKDEVLNGPPTLFTYEGVHGQLDTVTNALQETTEFQYDPSGNLKKIITPLLRELNMTYYPDGTVETVTDPLSRVARFDYDAQGNVETITLTAGSESPRVTSFVNTSSGYSESITNPLPETFDITRDLWDRPRSLTNHAQHTTAITYDAVGNLETVTPPGRPAHGFLYDERDWNTAYVPPELKGQDLRTTRARNDELQLELVTSGDSSRTIDYHYDPISGRLETTTIERGTYQRQYHPQRGQLKLLVAPDDDELNFSYQGRYLTGVRRSDGLETTYTYDPVGRVDALRIVKEPANCVPDGGPIASWPADGTPIDVVGGYDGTLNGDVSYVNGIRGQAFSFDGNGDWIEAPVPVQGMTSGTLALWFRTSTTQNQQDLMHAPNNQWAVGFWFATDVQSTLLGAPALRLLGEDVNYADGQWHQLVATFDPTSHRLYYDGALVANQSVAMPALTADNDLIMGCVLPGLFCSTADVDEPTVYGRALTSFEIEDLYVNQTNLLCIDEVLAEIDYEYDADGAVKQAHDVTMMYEPATGLLETVSLGDLTQTRQRRPDPG